MPNQKNIHQLAEIIHLLSESKATILTEYAGLTVAEQNELRKAASAEQSDYLVTKNNLLRLALKETGNEDLAKELADVLSGPTGVLFTKSDPVSGAKLIVKFAEDHEKLAIKKGIMEGKVISKNDITALSKLPGRNELLAKLLAQLSAPAQALVRQLSAPMQNLVYALEAIKNK